MPQSPSRFHVERRVDVTGPVLAAAGRFVTADGADADAWLQAAAALPGRRVAVDLADVTDIDAAGIGVLVRLARQSRCLGRELYVVAAGPRVRRVLEAVRLDAVLHLPPAARPRRPAQTAPILPPRPDKSGLAFAR